MGLGEQKCRVGRRCRKEGDDLEDVLLGKRLVVDMRPPWLAPSTRQSWKLSVCILIMLREASENHYRSTSHT